MNKLAKLTAVSTAALFAASAGAVAADKPTLKLGGYMDQKITVNSQSGAYESANGNAIALDQRNDTEVYFLGAVTLDNGITIKTRVELEGMLAGSAAGDGANTANGSPDLLDESFMDISGSFGSIRLGSQDLIGKRMSTGHQATFTRNVGENTRFNITKVIGKPSTVSNSVISQLDLSSDGEAISYMSPTIGGFKFGVGYAASAAEDYDGLNFDTALNKIMDGAVQWSGKFGGSSVSVAAAYTTATATSGNSDPKQWSVGGRVSVGNITVGLSTQHNEASAATGSQANEEDIVEAGVTYKAGANAFSVVGAWSTMDSSDAAVKNDETQAYSIAWARTLGPGVKWHNTLHIANYDNGDAGAAASTSNDGYAFTTGIKVSF